MSSSIPMSRAGYDKIRAELEQMENVEMPLITAEGDLSENAEYHAQRENQGMLQAKIYLLRDKLARANIVDMSKLPKDEVAFGATVLVKDLDFDDQESFTLTGAGEEDYDTGKILCTSPIGEGLIGKKVGDQVKIAVPKGTLKFEILEIKYEEL